MRCAGRTGRRLRCNQAGRAGLEADMPAKPPALGRGGVHTRIGEGRRMDSLFILQTHKHSRT